MFIIITMNLCMALKTDSNGIVYSVLTAGLFRDNVIDLNFDAAKPMANAATAVAGDK